MWLGCSLILTFSIYPSLCVVLLQCIMIRQSIFSQVSMEGIIQSTEEHIFTLDGLYRTLCDRSNKSSSGTPEAFPLFCAAFVPLPKPPVRLFRGRLNWHKEAMRVAAESSSRQGIRRCEKKMLISMWEQQECPGITEDCVKFSLEEPFSGEKCPPYSKRS